VGVIVDTMWPLSENVQSSIFKGNAWLLTLKLFSENKTAAIKALVFYWTFISSI